MKLVIIKYNAGNIQSVIHALNRLDVEPILSDDVEVINSADKVIFPGVGEASSAMQYLRERNLDKVIPALKQPVLGICLGLQLLCAHSEENDARCMNVFDVEVKKFRPEQAQDKVPQIGWNSLNHLQSPLFKGIAEESYVYFVHSYYAELSKYTIAQCDYIHPFSASLHRDNFYAAQFHPEKSGNIGAQIIQNFIEL